MGKQNNDRDRREATEKIEEIIEEINEFYRRGEYLQALGVIEEALKTENLKESDVDEILLKKGWIYHQLGKYDRSREIMKELSKKYDPLSGIGKSARHGLAQGLLQSQGKEAFPEVERILKEIPSSPEKDNLMMNYYMKRVRGEKIPVEEIFKIINKYIGEPFTTIGAHIINNGTFAIYEGRNQEECKKCLKVLPGLIRVAIGIYEITEAPPNHLAGAYFRASKICEVGGLIEEAILYATKAVKMWNDLAKGENSLRRFKQNLERAQQQLKRLREQHSRENNQDIGAGTD